MPSCRSLAAPSALWTCAMRPARPVQTQLLKQLKRREELAAAPATGSNWHPQRLSTVRGFALHLHAIDPAHEVPSAELLPQRPQRAVPKLAGRRHRHTNLCGAARRRVHRRLVPGAPGKSRLHVLPRRRGAPAEPARHADRAGSTGDDRDARARGGTVRPFEPARRLQRGVAHAVAGALRHRDRPDHDASHDRRHGRLRFRPVRDGCRGPEHLPGDRPCARHRTHGRVLASGGGSPRPQVFVEGFSTALTINAMIAIAAAIAAALTLGGAHRRPRPSSASPTSPATYEQPAEASAR